jgi:hypothetical protein
VVLDPKGIEILRDKDQEMHLFRLYQSLGLYSHIPYDASAWDLENADLLPLDPIKVAGGADLATITRMAETLQCVFALQALGWLEDIDDLWIVPPPERPPRFIPTPAPYHPHLQYLAGSRVGVLASVTAQDVRFVSSYFAIPKNDEVSRSIFNGRALSDRCHVPPPVNLPDITDIIYWIKQLTAESKGKLWGMTGDIRHWFHQIRTGPRVYQYFGLCCREQFYQWRCLPMGWSYSPRICQCIAWVLILFNDSPECNRDGLRQARSEIRAVRDPPSIHQSSK